MCTNDKHTGDDAQIVAAVSTSEMSVNIYQTTWCTPQKTAIFILTTVRTWNLTDKHNVEEEACPSDFP
jgi:hypothetical protein